MAFTSTIVSHTFQNADGTPASGSLTFSLSKRMTNGTLSLVPSELTANLNASGVLSVTLSANTDPATTPTDAQWRVDARILGAQPETWWIVVPTATPTADLFSLLPNVQPTGA